MFKQYILSVVLAVPTIASIFMAIAFVLNRRLIYDDSLLGLELLVSFTGTLSSIIGLIYSLVLARKYSSVDIGAYGIISGVGILANIVTVLIVLGGATAL